MGSKIVVTLLIVLTAAILTTMWCCRRMVDSATGFDRRINRAYQSLRNGMTKDEVFRRMGKPPVATNDHFLLGQYRGNEQEYAKTNGVNFSIFYLWDNGIDWVYCIGFDAQDKVVVKGQGGT